MPTPYEKLSALLKELFQLDQADLDFGIYRIMNQKRDEITHFLDNDLLPQVKAAFEQYRPADKKVIEAELQKAIHGAEVLGVDPNSVPKVKEIREQLASYSVDTEGLENEVYSHLYSFFRRYYDNGDFISMRRYKEGVYAIPYEGEEVKLHWANADQYYVKTTENFRDYTFRLPSGRLAHFKIVEAETEKDNVKSAEEKDRRFIMATENPVIVEEGALVMRFEYRADPEKRDQKVLNTLAAETILAAAPAEWTADLKTLSPTESNPRRMLLEKHLDDYTARNTFDYFIHKDLRGFLRRELDFYIKNEVMRLDDIEDEGTPRVEQYLSKIKVLRQIAHKIIEFLAQIEDFQKKLWLKKKFVVETNYCITLDRVPEDLYPEICANDAQREEWVRLFAIDEITGKQPAQPELGAAPKPGYSVPLTVGFLEANPFLVLDTKFFDSEFVYTLMASFENFDEQVNGLLLHSENYQALMLLRAKYSEKIKAVYIDPPYNTGDDDNFSYKDKFRSSSWLAMMSDRLFLAFSLMNQKGLLACHIDEHEHLSLEWLVKQYFGQNGDLGKLIWDKRNPKGDAKAVASQHEYIHFATSNISHLKSDDNAFVRNKENAETILTKASQLIKKAGKVTEDVRFEFKDWLSEQDFSGGEKAYCFIDNNGEVYQSVSMAWPNKKKAPNEYFIPLKHPRTGKDCPIPARGWRNPPETMSELIAQDLVIFGEDETTQPRRKYFLTENLTDSVASLYYMGSSDDALFSSMGFTFENPKPVKAAKYFLSIIGRPKDSYVIDYFAGSGTTAHGLIELNREDNGNRKYILVEMGEYFNTVLKPRIEKVIYSKDWKDGKPISREGSSHCFKYLRLESYEDTLNNLTLQRTKEQQLALEASPEFKENYMLSYMLDVESKDSLLNIQSFVHPFDYQLNIATGTVGESKPTRVDLVETFNYLIGLHVETMQVIRGYHVVTGKNPNGERTLIIWRDLTEKSNADLEEFFRKQDYNPRDMEFDLIYVNGDNNLENIRRPDETWKVRLIEEEFLRLMFDTEE